MASVFMRLCDYNKITFLALYARHFVKETQSTMQIFSSASLSLRLKDKEFRALVKCFSLNEQARIRAQLSY